MVMVMANVVELCFVLTNVCVQAYITIGDRGRNSVERIEQRVEFMTEGAKRKRLMTILETADPPIIVFLNQKQACDVLGRFLNMSGFSATVLHGGKVQDQREVFQTLCVMFPY